MNANPYQTPRIHVTVRRRRRRRWTASKLWGWSLVVMMFTVGHGGIAWMGHRMFHPDHRVETAEWLRTNVGPFLGFERETPNSHVSSSK